MDANFFLTGIFLHDKKDGRYTAFFSEVPEAVSQGETIEEAEKNLFDVLPMVMEVKNKSNQEDAMIDGVGVEVSQRTYKFQSAE